MVMQKELTENNDMVIVQEVLDGDRNRFEVLVRRYERLVFSIALHALHDRDQAEDAAQNAFMKAYMHLDSYNPEFKFSTWLSRITLNTCIDMQRRNRESVPIEELELPASERETPEFIVTGRDETRRLLGMLDTLDEKYRAPLLLYYSGGKKYDEIAATLSIPMSMVKNRIFRARRMLREQLHAVATPA